MIHALRSDHHIVAITQQVAEIIIVRFQAVQSNSYLLTFDTKWKSYKKTTSNQKIYKQFSWENINNILLTVSYKTKKCHMLQLQLICWVQNPINRLCTKSYGTDIPYIILNVWIIQYYSHWLAIPLDAFNSQLYLG